VFKNYFKTAIQNLLKRRFYSVINILGLSLGLTAAAITVLYVRHELSYDNFHHLSDRTYRISGEQEETWFASLSAPYSNALYHQTFPEVEAITRVRPWPPKFIRYANEKFYEDKILFTDPGSDFFKIFNFSFIQGNANEALKQPNAVVLTSSVAQKLFKHENSIGKAIIYDTFHLTVTGVIKDLPSNTHFDFTVLISNAQAMQDAFALNTYCVLSKNADINGFKNKLPALSKPANKFQIIQEAAIIPLRKLHFDANMTYEMKPPGSKLYLLLFNLIGLMIVFLSCVNYMNLSIAMYAERRKEIAVRKVVGAGNFGLALQFMIEAISLCLICLPFSLVLLQLILPWFNQFMQVQLRNEFIFSLPAFGILLGITLFIGIISGSYPAWVLPKLKATMLFHRLNITSRGGLNLRQVLVTFQITVLVIIISAGWIMYRQLDYIKQKDLGFNKDAVLKLKGAWMVDSAQYYALKNELLKSHFIKSVSQGFAPGDEDYGFSYKAEGSNTVYNDLILFGADDDYLKTLGIELLDANFKNVGKEKLLRYTLINETLARRLGYTEPVGKRIIFSPGKEYEETYIIDGVVKDFNFFSLHQPVGPMLLNIRPFGSGIHENILVKLQTPDISKAMDFIRKKTEQFIPNIPITAEFLDDSLNKLYNEEQKLSALTRVLMLVTLFLSITGLVGLASYMVQLRIKEIGVRKVLGASVVDILKLLGYSFIKMLVIAIVAGSCISIFAMQKWLQNFAYKTPVSWTVFAGTSAVLLFIIIITVCGHSLKAALVNPVKLLRTE